MNITFVGGGSYRTIPIVRAAMKEKKILDNGEIRLVDFNLERVETVAKMIKKTPEYKHIDCKVTFTDKLEEALPGADMVSVSFPVGSYKTCVLSDEASLKRGFFGGDQLSLSGAFRSLTGGAILLDIARKMEKYSPDAWLVDFANPVAVYSGMINNHTKIKALGICAGFVNHRWDLNRLIFDTDKCNNDFKVVSAGINHLSFILRGTCAGQDLYELIGKRLSDKNWEPCKITIHPKAQVHIHYALRLMAEMYQRFGKIIFSTEWDGMCNLFFEKSMEHFCKNHIPKTATMIEEEFNKAVIGRKERDVNFKSFLDKEFDQEFWDMDFIENPDFASNPNDVTVTILKALSGVSREWLAASFPNRGAVKGFKDRTVLEYSMFLDKNGMTPEPDLEVPNCFHGLISSLATHQTLLGDAIALKDPKILAQALFAYPIHQNTRESKALCMELLKIHEKEIAPEFQGAKDYL
jgi:6-phospho-beta-glucosidase